MTELKSAPLRSTRRNFIVNSVLGVSLVCSRNTWAIPPQIKIPEPQARTLSLFHEHTKEKLDVTYWKNGEYIDDIVGQLHYLLRDHKVGKAAPIDLKLYDFLHQLQVKLGATRRIHVLSGYRTPETNAHLRKTSLGVARNSFHTKGRAIDIYIPGMDANVIQQAARKLQLGGVGYYSKAGFVHLDTGYARHWTRA